MKTVSDFRKMKAENKKISMITAYDYPSAKQVERAESDLILVGDSLGMVVLGYDSTINVTLDDMVHHTKAARRGAPNTFIIADMPFASFHYSNDITLHNATRLIQETNANAVKLEGAYTEKIKLLTDAGIPVCAHLGLTPQSVGVLGGYKVQGKLKEDAELIIQNAIEIQNAGAFMLVLECVPDELAKHVTKLLRIPTIGIGAGKDTDGQVLVYHDIIKYGVDRLAKFVKPYLDANQLIAQALEQYNADVRSAQFPAPEHTFKADQEQLAFLYGGRNEDSTQSK